MINMVQRPSIKVYTYVINKNLFIDVKFVIYFFLPNSSRVIF